MKKFVLVPFIVLLFVSSIPSQEAVKATKNAKVELYSPETETTKPINLAADVRNKDVALTSTGERRLTLRERRQLGLTFKNVREARQELIDAGEINEDTSPSEQSVLILRVIKDKNAEGFGATDWTALIEAILAFIEQLLAFFN